MIWRHYNPRIGALSIAVAAGCGPDVWEHELHYQGTASVDTQTTHDSATDPPTTDGAPEPLHCVTVPAGTSTSSCASAYATHQFGELGCVGCICFEFCSDDDQCPEIGDAEARCLNQTCTLTCTNDTQCPDQMRCVPSSLDADNTSVCMWVEDDPLTCSYVTRVSPCDPIQDATTCNALQAEGIRCTWVDVETYAQGSCSPADQRPTCLQVVEENTESCAASGERLWVELIDGQIAIVELPCGWLPAGVSDSAFEGHRCSASDPPAPDACAC